MFSLKRKEKKPPHPPLKGDRGSYNPGGKLLLQF